LRKESLFLSCRALAEAKVLPRQTSGDLETKRQAGAKRKSRSGSTKHTQRVKIFYAYRLRNYKRLRANSPLQKLTFFPPAEPGSFQPAAMPFMLRCCARFLQAPYVDGSSELPFRRTGSGQQRQPRSHKEMQYAGKRRSSSEQRVSSASTPLSP